MPYEFHQPEESTGGGAILSHGWHTVQITRAEVVYRNGTRWLEHDVECVGPSQPGATLRRNRTKMWGNYFNGLGWACGLTTLPHGPNDSDTERAQAEIAACFLGRIYRAEVKPQRLGDGTTSNKYREIGWPQRPSAEQFAEVKPSQMSAPPRKSRLDDDEIPF